MFEKLGETEKLYEKIAYDLSEPEVVSDQERFTKLMREHKRLTPIVEKYREYMRLVAQFDEANELLNSGDSELAELAQSELDEAKEKLPEVEHELQILLLPHDPNDEKNVIMEIRGGAGGEEAALFAYVLYRMYNMYAATVGWKTEIISLNETELGGFKEVTFMIEGEGAYSRLKYESGVHRVQRVPETEAQGRIHTSTATVAVLPEAEDVEIEINQSDLIIETCKSSGAGGQHVNKTESAIRLIHKPTGIVIECQDERSQFKNRDKAMKLLRTKLFDMKQAEQDAKIASERRSQVGTGDRSERIRTYNYPQSRVTDHRIGLTLHSLESFLNGEIDEMLTALATADTAAKLAKSMENDN
ncbi:MAG: peptide chain release factor 1 [Clostridiales bacterium]|nr:peptide chain release factor 1 [Clostridiales bacterium]